ncbi:MAG: [protein-PII] uridylyltransferase [Microthrixaceae bacterium]
MPPALVRTDLLDDTGLRGRAFAEAWTTRIDEWLAELFEDALAVAGADATGLALVALGGQGRREMAPQSDLDLLLLFESADVARKVAEQLWYPIWDTGLKLGHSVRSVRDTITLAGEDLETATSLLSARHIAGEPALTTDLAERGKSNWRKRGRRWLKELAIATDERHAAAGEVAFMLEPDLKEGRGGLRDVHALAWASAAGAPIPTGLSDELMARHDVLLEVRVELHRRLGKPGDKLVLQEQDPISLALGDGDPDVLMKRVATAGRAIALASDEAWHDTKVGLDGGFFGRFRRGRVREAGGLVVKDARVALADETTPVQDPFAVLRVANLAATEQLRISEATLVALQEAPRTETPWRAEGRELFCELLLRGRPSIEVIEILEDYGLWSRLLPEWAPTVSRPQRNAYHRFTVDRHLLECAAEASALIQVSPRPDLLVMGALLHDIGKAYPELGDHSVCGADMAAAIAQGMGFDTEDVESIRSLVRHHLLLPDVATRRDISSSETISFVADEAGTAERVALLRAITEADSLATGPAAWSPWKADLVDQLAARAIESLEGSGASSPTGGFPTDEQRRLLRLPGVAVACEGEKITVSCRDTPGIFARVAGALALHGLDVVSANVLSEGNRALDEFVVRAGRGGRVPWDLVEVDVRKATQKRLALEARIQERVRSHSRPRNIGMHQFEPAVRFDNGASGGEGRTVIEVVGPDSVGLLYRLARALTEFDVDLSGARIDTIGHDVVDSFYVTSYGGPIEDPELQHEISRALMHALEAPA